MPTNGPPLYRDVQRFRQTWLWVLLVGLTVVVTGGGSAAALAVLRTLGQARSGPAVAALLVGVPLLAMACIVLLFWYANLTITVSSEFVHVRFAPFQPKGRTIPAGEIVSADVVTYRPLRDYGGWGIRLGRDGWAYTTGGTEGVRITLRDGSRILLGSVQAESLHAAIVELLPDDRYPRSGDQRPEGNRHSRSRVGSP